MKIIMRLITASYRQNDVTVELFGRCSDGKSVAALYFGFKPYFDYVDPDDTCIRKIEENSEFIIIEGYMLLKSSTTTISYNPGSIE